MKRTPRTNKAPLQGMATGTPLLLVFAVSLATSGFVLSANANERKTAIITFDAPGAVNGTFANAINPGGTIAGGYSDSVAVHGYVRARDGTFTTFDVPGAGLNRGQSESINPAGTITGVYLDPSIVVHGFVRARDGAITTFDAPGAGTGSGQAFLEGTFAFNINPAGVIAGNYTDASLASHGFVRAPNGAITTFDAPGAGTGPNQGTFTGTVGCINPAGAIIGNYSDASNVFHGYVRSSDGTFTTFDIPGAGTGSGQGTSPGFINSAGAITGYFLDASTVYHGFVRAPSGAITTFDVPGAGTGPFQGTQGGAGITPGGIATGDYIDASYVSHGFVRTPKGAITTFDAPGAGTGPGQGTFPGDINPAGAIVGSYVDASGVSHGFLLGGK